MRWWRPLAIVLVGVLLGLAWNGLSGRGFALEKNVFLEEGDQTIEAAEAKRRLDKGALFLDARPRLFYEMKHIPGALALPEDDFDKAFAELEPKLRTTFDIVVYCSGFGCEASHIVSRRLKERGIASAIFTDGWPAWTDAGYPVREGKQP